MRDPESHPLPVLMWFGGTAACVGLCLCAVAGGWYPVGTVAVSVAGQLANAVLIRHLFGHWPWEWLRRSDSEDRT